MDQNPYQAPAVAPRDPRRIMLCQGCGVEAPTRNVEFLFLFVQALIAASRQQKH